MKTFNLIPISEAEINDRIAQITDRGFLNLSEIDALILSLSMIDLTTLEGADTDEKVIKMCKKAFSYNIQNPQIPNVAAVCVYPTLVKIAKKTLVGKNINIAAVAGAFPSGQSPINVKVEEVKYAVLEGADEIDMVISRGKFLEGKFEIVFNEIVAIKQACGTAHLKVILETGELETLSNIKLASEIAISAGADFIKTSTGKISPAATEQAFLVMLDVIKEHYLKTGKMIGIKPAGGISETKSALRYLMLLEETLGEKWLNNQWARFGASRLADNVYNEILAKI
jgi:deoxyribose-phosphate aldolase